MRKALFFIAFVLPFVDGCDSQSSATGTIQLVFSHKVADKALTLSNLDYTNEAGNVYRVSLLEYIMTNIALIGSDGKAVKLKDVQYVNHGKSATLTATLNDIKADHYQGIEFDFGIPASQNKTGGLPNTQDFNNMEWPVAMGGGYHYMRIEGKYKDGAEEKTFAIHTGPNAGVDYSIHQKLNTHLHLAAGETATLTLKMDLNEWLKTPNKYDFKNFTGNIMGDANAQKLIQANGADAFSAEGN